jgi:hypothetical protein
MVFVKSYSLASVLVGAAALSSAAALPHNGNGNNATPAMIGSGAAVEIPEIHGLLTRHHSGDRHGDDQELSLPGKGRKHRHDGDDEDEDEDEDEGRSGRQGRHGKDGRQGRKDRGDRKDRDDKRAWIGRIGRRGPWRNENVSSARAARTPSLMISSSSTLTLEVTTPRTV